MSYLPLVRTMRVLSPHNSFFGALFPYQVFLYISALLGLFSPPAMAQETLIPNPSFELHENLQCGVGGGIEPVWFWYDARESGSADYSIRLKYEHCYPDIEFMEPAHGNGYISFFSRGEPIRAMLEWKMEAGKFYTIRFSTRVSPRYVANDNFGFYFSHQPITISSQVREGHSNIQPQVVIKELIENYKNWKEYAYTFRIEDNYQHLMIGNFFKEEDTRYKYIANSKESYRAKEMGSYIYLDHLRLGIATEEEIEGLQRKMHEQALAILHQSFGIVHFPTGSYTLTEEAKAILESLMDAICQQSLLLNHITLTGQTDAVGDSLANLKLSQKRAKAVKEYLIELGIQEDRLTAEGNGKTSESEHADRRYRNVSFDFELKPIPLKAGIEFEEFLSWKGIQRKAQVLNRPIFLDAYTTWCGPCKALMKKTFPHPKLAKFFNDEFISVRVDMESEEGLLLGEKWAINSYPTLLFLDPDQALTYRADGFRTPKGLMDIGRKALKKGPSLEDLQAAFDRGDHSMKTLVPLVDWLRDTGKDYNTVLNTYFASLPPDQEASPTTWKVINQYVRSIYHSGFGLFQKHYKTFEAHLGEKTVDQFRFNMYRRTIGDIAFKGNKEDWDTYHKACKELATSDLPQRRLLLARTHLIYYSRLGKWDFYAQALDEWGEYLPEKEVAQAKNLLLENK